MGFVRYGLGALLGLGMMVVGMTLEGGHLSSIVQLTAFLIVVGPTLGYLVMGFPLGRQVASLRAAFAADAGNRQELLVARQYFTAMGQGFLMFGFVGVVLGLIHVMENLANPERIGPGVAVAFVSMLYGFLFRLASSAMEHAVTEKINAGGLT